MPQTGLQPSSSASNRVSPRMAWFLGATCVIVGSAVVAGGILGDDARMEAPRWIVAAAGAAFLLTGVALVRSYAFERGIEPPADLWSSFFGALVCSCFTLIGGWIAFGPGERRFHVSGSLLFVWLPSVVIGWLGRAVFGLGALLVAVMTLVFWWRLLRGLAGRPAREQLQLGGAFLATTVAALAVLHATGDLRLWPANRALHRALAAPGLTDTDRLLLVFDAKLANPAYAQWQRLSLGRQPYEAFAEEALLKEIRSRIAASMVPPPGASLITIPLVTGAAPVIDGRLGANEWQDAARSDLGKGTTLYALSDGRQLYMAADVPSDTTEAGFDQLRVYYHVDLADVIANERVHVSRSPTDAFASYRLSHLPRRGEGPPRSVSESHIYRHGRGASSMIEHRQFELALDLEEAGLHRGVPFAAYVEVETDPLTDWDGRFRARVLAGHLGSHAAPVWLVIGGREQP